MTVQEEDCLRFCTTNTRSSLHYTLCVVVCLPLNLTRPATLRDNKMYYTPAIKGVAITPAIKGVAITPAIKGVAIYLLRLL